MFTSATWQSQSVLHSNGLLLSTYPNLLHALSCSSRLPFLRAATREGRPRPPSYGSQVSLRVDQPVCPPLRACPDLTVSKGGALHMEQRIYHGSLSPDGLADLPRPDLWPELQLSRLGR